MASTGSGSDGETAAPAFVNPLASPAQLEASSSELDGVPQDLENSVRFANTKYIQAAGVLLRLPQDLIAHAIVLYTRFWIGPEGGSLKVYNAQDISAACLYLVTKPSAHPKSPRSIINVDAYLSRYNEAEDKTEKLDPESYYVSEGTYQRQRAKLVQHEMIILRTLGFQTHVALPYTLCINYLQTLQVFTSESGKAVANRAFAHLNTCLLSPQLVYLTHQPCTLSTAAIYLAAREIGVKLPEVEWWAVFDTDREELGFLVVAMLSMANFAAAEQEKWTKTKRKVPMTVAEINAELQYRNDSNHDASAS